jgi:6-phosphogluconolactonase (cycloisomerase 2 family)
MVNFTILAGGYTSFVASYLFNSKAGSLTLLSQSPTGSNPSWITSHPTNSNILYAVNEVSSGVLQSFTINTDGSLAGPVEQISSGGNSPAYASALSTSQVAIMNYGSGNGEMIPTVSDPLHFSQNASLITFPPPDGGVSHPHMALEHGAEVFISDLVSCIAYYAVQNYSDLFIGTLGCRQNLEINRRWLSGHMENSRIYHTTPRKRSSSHGHLRCSLSLHHSFYTF